MTDLPRLARRASVAAVILASGAALVASASARAAENTMVSGSVYVDSWTIQDELAKTRAPDGVSPEASLKLQVDINDDVAFSVKACAMCHGIELEHAYLDIMPATAFNMQVGRIAVPFGEYSQRIDPSGHATASAPLIYDMGRMAYGERTAMNLGIIPLPYTDTGVMIYGVKWLGPIQAWYGLYGVAGLRGSNDLDWKAMRSAPYNDNNDEPAGGARLALTYSGDADAFLGDLSVGGSVTGGRYDRDAKLMYLAWGVDASMKLGPFTMRGEYAERKTDLDPNGRYRFELVDDWFKKSGFYGELEHPLGAHIRMVYRYDELRRTGMPLPGSTAQLSTDSNIVRYTAGTVISPSASLFIKLSWEYWEPTDFEKFHSFHVGFGGAF
jgi:hypothetical protein